MLPASLISNLGSESGRFDVNVVAAEGALHFELDGAVNEGVERVVLARADVVAGVELRAALTNDDAASVDGCIAETFTPRRFALESRPLRVEPPPFLCAIFYALLKNWVEG